MARRADDLRPGSPTQCWDLSRLVRGSSSAPYRSVKPSQYPVHRVPVRRLEGARSVADSVGPRPRDQERFGQKLERTALGRIGRDAHERAAARATLRLEHAENVVDARRALFASCRRHLGCGGCWSWRVSSALRLPRLLLVQAAGAGSFPVGHSGEVAPRRSQPKREASG